MSTPWEDRIVTEAFMTPETERVKKISGPTGQIRSVLVDGHPVNVVKVPHRGRTNRVGNRYRAYLPGEPAWIDGAYETKKGALSAAFLAAVGRET